MVRAIQFPDSGEVLPFQEYYNHIRINVLEILQGQPADGEAIR